MANNRIQVKRTSVSGRTANTTAPSNSQYIAAGELALNMPDGILYSSNGSSLIVVGANVVNQNITGNLTVKAVIANGSIGSAGQTLSSNGSAVYWATLSGTGTVSQVNTGNGLTGGPITSTGTVSVNANNGIVANSSGLYVKAGDNIVVNSTGVHASAGVNTAAQYTFTNTVSFTQTINGTSNNSFYLGGKTEGNLNVNSALVANNTNFVGAVAAVNVVSNAQLSGNLVNYQTTAGLAANVATLAANSATYLGGNTASDLRTYSDQKAGNAYTNAVSYVDGKSFVNTSQLSTNLANYQTTAGLASNVATLTANNTSFVGTVSAANVVSNAQLAGNLANYVTTTNLTNNLANYQTTAGLAANVATLTANNTSFVGTVSAANVVSNAQLSANLANYQTTAGLSANVATLTANNTSFVGTVSAANVVSNAQLSSNLANYQTTAGLSANVATLTANNANNLNGQPASFYTNATNITSGTLPYAQIPANVINTTAAFTISGVHTHNANVILGSSGLSANASFGTAGQVLHSNGTATYWATDDQGVTSVATGNGLTGGTITTTGTVSVLANTGIVANATGVYVNATYIGTLSANNTTYVNGKTEGNLNVNSAVYANNSAYAFGKTEGNLNVNSAVYANNSTYAYGKTEGNLNVNNALTANYASYINANTGVVSNSSGVFVNSSYIDTLGASSLGGVPAANYVQNTDSRILSGNLNFTGANNVFTTRLVVNSTVINSTGVYSANLYGNLTGNVAATTISGNLTGNVAAVTITGNLTGNVIATTVYATTVNATTVNAASHTVGTALVANATGVYSTGTVNAAVVSSTNATFTRVTDVVQAAGDLRTNLGNPSVEEKALFHGQFNNKFRFISPTSQEESTDGVTWVASSRATSARLGDMMIGEGQGTSIGIIPSGTIGTADYYRLTWDVVGTTGYVYLNHLYIYLSTQGNQVTFTVEAYNNGTTVWDSIASGTSSAWPGHFSLKHSTIPYSSNPAQYSKVRVVFSVASRTNTNNIQLFGIEWFGGYPSGRRNAESYDRNKNVTFPANVAATGAFTIGANVIANTTGTYATHLGGTAAASFVQNTDSRTLSGNLVFSGANTTVNAEFRVVNSTANVFFAGANGNVGIGVSNPAYKLAVAGTITTSGAGGSLAMAPRDGTGTVWQIYNQTGDDLRFYGNSSDRMTIDNSGNVGIGTSAPGYKLQVNGSFAATTKSFVIDHPTKPDMKLRHGSLEGPENGVYVRGRSNTDTIVLPDYWSGLVDEDSVTVNITPIGKKQSLYVKEANSTVVTVGGGKNMDYYFTVYAERRDVEKLTVEFKNGEK